MVGWSRVGGWWGIWQREQVRSRRILCGERRGDRWCGRRVGKNALVEYNVTGDDDAMSGEIVAAITFVLEWIAKKDAPSGAGREFVGGSGIKVRVTKTPKHVEVIIGGVNAVKHVVGSMTMNGAGGTPVKKIGGDM